MEQLLWRLKNGELPPIVPPKVIVIACGTNSKGMVSGRLSAPLVLGGIVAFCLFGRCKRMYMLACQWTTIAQSQKSFSIGSSPPFVRGLLPLWAFRPYRRRRFGREIRLYTP